MAGVNAFLSIKRPSPLQVLSTAAVLCILIGWMVFRAVFAIQVGHERRQATQRLEAFALSLEATLARHESLPGLLALDPSLEDLLRHPQDPAKLAAANQYLEAVHQRTGGAATYLLDTKGLTLAASNWREPHSFIGHNYAFRPYFTDALTHGLGRFYAVGVTTGEPGYFLGTPIVHGGQALGVVVLKISLDVIERALANADDTLLLVDGDGVVFLSSHDRLRYRTLASVPQAVSSRLTQTRQYGQQTLLPLADRPIPLDSTEPLKVALLDEPPIERVVHSRSVGDRGWRVVQLGNPTAARATALAAGVACAFAAAFVFGLVAHMRHRHRKREELRLIYNQLENRIAERTAYLTEQVAALERNKAILRETRDAAVQAGKLATLGQMSAGISHELSQPLAALQTFADNARSLLAMGRTQEAVDNLDRIGQLIDRTGRIVRQLKTFARKEASTPHPVSVASAIEHALLIVEPRRREMGVFIDVNLPPSDWLVLAEEGRLEQVLVNLMRNGMDAMDGCLSARLEIRVERETSVIAIKVRDHGPGLDEVACMHLFEPFYTTKPAGLGLGLGLAISLTIVQSYGGTLAAHNAPDGGAEFVLRLPTPEESHVTTPAP